MVSDLEIKEDGNLKVYIDNASSDKVYFDEFIIERTEATVAVVVQENHYYPFGMNMKGIEELDIQSINNEDENRWQFNGVEKNESFGLNWNETFYRTYDYQLGRWNAVDSKPTYSEGTFISMKNNPILYADFLGDTITTENEADRAATMGYMNEVFGEGVFGFDNNNQLQFLGEMRDLDRKQKYLAEGFVEVINSSYNANVKMSDFTEDETALLDIHAEKQITGETGGGLSVISLDSEGNIVGAKILIREADLKPVPLYNETYAYVDDEGNLKSSSTKPEGRRSYKSFTIRKRRGQNQTVDNPPSAVYFHEIGHLLNEGKNQSDVIKFENKARQKLNLPKRSTDPAH